MSSPVLNGNLQLILDRVAALRLPAIYPWVEEAEEGGFAAYGPSIVQNHPADHDPKARFRNAQRHADFTIDQHWSAYSPAEHNRWDRLFKRSHSVLRKRACGELLAATEKLEPPRSLI